MTPLSDITVLDFSTLLPGPLASLVLAQAGAKVIKVERPTKGDELRGYQPRAGADSTNFALLNAGKESLVADLKDADGRAHVLDLAANCDVVIEQFRPGVMDRLGVGYTTLAASNPRLVYCSITGYGQTGPRAQQVGHDLSYLVDTGLLNLGAPVVPPALIADVGAGALPAVTNILLALMDARRTGRGRHLDVSMTDHLYPFAYWALGGAAVGDWPEPASELVTGGSPRYAVYECADGRHVAAAPLEDRFWTRFCDVIELDRAFQDDGPDPEATRAAVAARLRTRPAADWARLFQHHDVPAALVRTIREALDDSHFQARGLFDEYVHVPGFGRLMALPPTVDPGMRVPAAERATVPQLNPTIQGGD